MGVHAPIVTRAAVGALVISHLGYGEDGGGSPYSYTGVNFGDAAADRFLVAGLCLSGGASTASAVTIGGVMATLLNDGTDDASYVSGGEGVQLWGALVPSGTSGAIEFTFSGSARSSYDLFRLTGANTSPTKCAFDNDVDPLTASVNVPAGGCVIAIAVSRNSGGWTWTGLDKTTDENIEVLYPSAAFKAFAAAQSPLAITADPSGNTTTRLAVAVFEPA